MHVKLATLIPAALGLIVLQVLLPMMIDVVLSLLLFGAGYLAARMRGRDAT